MPLSRRKNHLLSHPLHDSSAASSVSVIHSILTHPDISKTDNPSLSRLQPLNREIQEYVSLRTSGGVPNFLEPPQQLGAQDFHHVRPFRGLGAHPNLLTAVVLGERPFNFTFKMMVNS